MSAPPAAVLPVAIGIARRGGQILAQHLSEGARRLTGVRPPGGAIAFMEPAADALHRAFREEFGCAVAIEGAPAIFESLDDRHAAPRHEIVFAYPIRLEARRFYEQDRFELLEGDGGFTLIEWVEVARLVGGEVPLFPIGLLDHLAQPR